MKPADTGVRVSLVVATVGRSHEVRVMLDSMVRQTEKRFELIVVDQNADDRLVPIIDQKRAEGLVICHMRRSERGVSGARNAGLALARAPIVAFPDDDCWYEPEVVAGALAHLEEHRSAVGLVGHWVDLDPEGRRAPAPLDPHRWRRYKGGDAVSFALFFRTAALQAIGGFCEYLGTGCYFGSAEEDDLILSLLGAGARIDYVPTIHIHHHHSDAPVPTGALRRRSRTYGRGTGAVLAKHRFPLWIIARGLIGPVYRALRAPNTAGALILSGYTVLGRVEGLLTWWLRGERAARTP